MESTMKITPVDNKLGSPTPVGDRKGAAPKAPVAEPSAKVELSPAAQLASQSLNGNFDAQKVERMAQAIKDGSFKVDADAIADKLIANAREQLARTYRQD